jgi:uncharacterized membrane protein YhiD involved in acid resistance
MNWGTEHILVFTLTPMEVIFHLSVALVCGVFISLLYRLTYRGVNYSSNYVVSIIMLTMITALVIMVIGNNLARAFGLVGAMSIIRFRTAIKDTQDIMFIFFALAIGLACGAGMFLLAIIGSVFIGCGLWLAIAVNSENPRSKPYLLQVYMLSQHMDERVIIPSLERYCKRVDMINMKTLGESDRPMVELSYYVYFKRARDGSSLLSELNKLEGIQKVNLFYDEA